MMYLPIDLNSVTSPRSLLSLSLPELFVCDVYGRISKARLVAKPEATHDIFFIDVKDRVLPNNLIPAVIFTLD